MPDPNNTRVYRGHTGLQSKVPTQVRGGGQPGNQQSHSRNASPPGGVGVRAPFAPGSAADADPPLGVGVKVGALPGEAPGTGVSTPDAPDVSTV